MGEYRDAGDEMSSLDSHLLTAIPEAPQTPGRHILDARMWRAAQARSPNPRNQRYSFQARRIVQLRQYTVLVPSTSVDDRCRSVEPFNLGE